MYDPARAEKLLKYHLSKKLYSPHIQNAMDVYLNNNYGTLLVVNLLSAQLSHSFFKVSAGLSREAFTVK